MSAAIVWDDSVQGSDEWKALRSRGFITGSKASAARSKNANGTPKADYLAYAHDVARMREGGSPLEPFQNATMRFGSEQEPIARMKYEAKTGEMVEEVGFAYTTDGKFGCSSDGLVGSDGAIEVKTMVSSSTMFKSLVDGDITEYRDQCLMEIWLLNLRWVDVVMWCPDLSVLRIVRVNRDEAELEAFMAEMLEFDRYVESLRHKLRAIRAEWSTEEAPTAPAAITAEQKAAERETMADAA